MAHPIKHAQSSARSSVEKRKTISRFITGSTSRKRSSRTLATGLCVIMLRVFFWPRNCLA
jgi:hypothetical protein